MDSRKAFKSEHKDDKDRNNQSINDCGLNENKPKHHCGVDFTCCFGLTCHTRSAFAIEIAIAAAPAVATIPTTAAAATALVETVLSSAVSVGAESTAGSDAWSLG